MESSLEEGKAKIDSYCSDYTFIDLSMILYRFSTSHPDACPDYGMPLRQAMRMVKSTGSGESMSMTAVAYTLFPASPRVEWVSS